jgi:MFS family permease
VPILRGTYGASNLQVGLILALDAIGIAIGTSLPARYAGYLTGMGLLAVGWGGFGIAPDLLVAAPLSVIGGIGNGVVIVRFRTMMQRETPPHERASTIGFAYAVTFSMIVAGQIAVVPLSNTLGERATFTAAGTVFALGGLVAALCWPSAVTKPARVEIADGSPVRAR